MNTKSCKNKSHTDAGSSLSKLIKMVNSNIGTGSREDSLKMVFNTLTGKIQKQRNLRGCIS
jgi:hypothetical protein